LPDFKYADKKLAYRYSQARNYPEVALNAIKEMYRQKGSALILNESGLAESGIILRHLVLPGAVDQSIDVLRLIASELSPKLHISLMSQYYPTKLVNNHSELKRTILPEEYKQVTDAFYEFGFYRGWIQDLESQASYRPHFGDDQPFK
jgi:putative pyruvate formate lyase activating enzyme